MRFVEAKHPDDFPCAMAGFTWWLQTVDVVDALGRGGLERMPAAVRCNICDVEPMFVALHPALPPHAIT